MTTKIKKPPRREAFRTQPERGLPSSARVDREKRVIYGAKAMQAGKLSQGDARPWKVDRVTLEQLVELGSAREGGIKMRFAHPNASRDGLGRHVGRASNPRLVDGENGPYVAFDAQLNAKGGPRTQDQVEHLLDLAEVAPEDFGLSLACSLDHDAMGKMDPDRDGLKAIRLKSLEAIDFVDEPAATSGLFALDTVDIQDLPAQATEILDEYFAEAPADVIRTRFGEFLDRYLSNRGDEDMSTKPTTDTKPTSPPAADGKGKLSVEEDVASLQAEIAALKAEIAAMKDGKAEGEGEEMSEGEEKKPDAAMAAKRKSLAELSRRKEITALCKLAKVPDDERDLLLGAGFSRLEAQQWIRDAGYLSKANKPVDEGNSDVDGKKPTREELLGKEYDQNADIHQRQGLSKEAYVKSRLKDAA